MSERFLRILLGLAAGVLVVIEILFATVFYHQSTVRIEEEEMNSMHEINEDIDEMLALEDHLKKINIDTAYLVRLEKLLYNGYASNNSEITTRTNATRALKALQEDNASVIQSIYVVLMDEQAEYMLTNSGIKSIKYANDLSWQEAFQESVSGDFCSFRSSSVMHEQSDINVLTMYHYIESKHWDTGRRVKGCIVINYHLYPILQKLNHSINSSYGLCLYDTKTGDYYTSGSLEKEQEEEIQNIIHNNLEVGKISARDTIYFHTKSESMPLGFVLFCEGKNLFQMLRYQILMIIMADSIMVICFVLFFLIYQRQNKKYLLNIQRLLEVSREEAALMVQSPIADRQEQEVARLMLSHDISKKEMQELLQWERNKSIEMEMLALQSQTNPHFLLNTIDFIYWNQVGETGFSSKMSRMLENLSQMLKYSLDTSTALVSLEEELKHVRTYLEIQDRRKGQKAEITMEIPEKLKSVQMLKILLQPVIENSYKYAMNPLEEKPLSIRIKAYMEGKDLLIAISDSGIGMSMDKMEEINRKMESGRHDSGHIGLANINRRLQLYYGSSSGVRLSKTENGGLTVTLRMQGIERKESEKTNIEKKSDLLGR